MSATQLSATFLCLLLSTLSAGSNEFDAACNVTVQLNSSLVNRTRFDRVNITDAKEKGAVCNDWTDGIYYLSETRASNKWLIFLESGSGCGSVDDCNERYDDQHELMSSNDYPANITGKDIFDPDPRVNPDYWDFNSVLIPYCTSDLWVGSSNWTEDEKREASEGVTVNNTYNPMKFAFRGLPLFRAVVDELMQAGLSTANEVVLAGSSAGGIGVLNHAGWLREQLPSANMSAILDSSWFINFDNNLVENFNFDFLDNYTNYLSHEPCKDNDTLGFPCCVSASCMLSKPMQLRGHYDFPDIPTFAIFSMYDLYIMSQSIEKLENESSDVRKLEAFRTIAEYGGAMNFSLESYQHAAKKMSYFVPSCLQHVYLATSNMWDDGGFLNNSVNSSNHNHTLGNTKFFEHVIREGTWAKIFITSNTNRTSSLQCAIHEWNQHIHSTPDAPPPPNSSYPVRYIDDCFGARCNPNCPETVLLGLFPDFWQTEMQFLLISMVLLVTMLCIFYKTVMMVKMYYLVNDYQKFLAWDKLKEHDCKRGLPYCGPKEAIGIAFLHLQYSIRLSPQALVQAKKIQEEKLAAEEESRALLGLGDDSDDETDGRNPRKYKKRSSRSSTDQSQSKMGILKRLLCCCGKQNGHGHISKSVSRDFILKNDDIELGLRSPVQNGSFGFQRELSNGVLSGKSATMPASYRRSFDVTDFAGSELVKQRSQTMPARIAVPEVSNDKMIIKGVSSYFNPGQLVAIMGPSGCGKTTFLDLLTGRRRKGKRQGEIFINGIPSHLVHDWYVKHTGYVLQLAVPYYEELTVQQNLLLSAYMRLPRSMTQYERFERVGEVIEETGLTALKDTVVGGSTGPGLSGGQKRRLAVAIQLLSMPKVIFLDEPTSGLDASSSMELLQHLRYVAMSNRMVVLTIHQPRLEIFHMFDIILFLCQGEVAYYGSPDKAPELFLKAYQIAKLEGDAPVLDQSKNPADVIMDMLGSEKYRTAILNYYKMTLELTSVENAIKKAKRDKSPKKLAAENERSDSGWANRFLALETRAAMRANLTQSLYLPIIFLIYALILGLAYLQAETALLIMAAFCVFSFASSIFMFPAVFTHLSKSLQMYTLEREDGVGRSVEVLLQTFMRYVAIAAIPLVACSLILYLMVLKPEFWSFLGFFRIAVFSLAMNQTWVAISMMLVSLFPVQGHRISPLTSCAAGFAGGFLIPAPQMKPYFAWLFYINPNFYGYASMMRLIMPDIETGCDFDSTIECYPSTGKFWLEHFGFQFTRPFLSLVIMMIITAVAFLVAWMALEKRYRGISFLDCILHCRLRQSADMSNKLSHSPSEESSIKSAEEEEVNSEEEFNVVSISGSDNEDPREDDEPGSAALSPMRRYSDARGVKKRNNATEEELEDAEKKANEMAAMKHKRKLQRQVTRTLLLPSREHSVFCPEDTEDSSQGRHPSFSRMSRRDRLRTTAREMQQKQQQMKSRMMKFQEMQDHLTVNDTDLNSMNHSVPLSRLQASIYKRQPAYRRPSPGSQSMSCLDPWKTVTRSVDNVKKIIHHTSSCDPLTSKSMADLRRGSGSSGVSFDVSRLAPGSDSDTNTPINPAVAAQGGRRASVTFTLDTVEGSPFRQRSSSPSPLIPRSAIKKRPQSLQNTPNLTPEGTPSPRARKKTKKTITPDVDPDVSNTLTTRTRQRFTDRPFQIQRRIMEREHENSIDRGLDSSSEDEEIDQRLKIVRQAAVISPSGSENDLALMHQNAKSYSSAPAVVGDETRKMRRPSSLSLRPEVKREERPSWHSDDVFGTSPSQAPQSQTPLTPMISITRCFSGDTSEPTDDCDTDNREPVEA